MPNGSNQVSPSAHDTVLVSVGSRTNAKTHDIIAFCACQLLEKSSECEVRDDVCHTALSGTGRVVGDEHLDHLSLRVICTAWWFCDEATVPREVDEDWVILLDVVIGRGEAYKRLQDRFTCRMFVRENLDTGVGDEKAPEENLHVLQIRYSTTEIWNVIACIVVNSDK
jgi:hypothetical protein